jgi:hypothetical protein
MQQQTTVIPATRKAEIQRIAIWGLPEQKKKTKKISKTPISTNKPGMIITASWEVVVGGSKSMAGPGKKHETLSKKQTEA